MIYYRPLIPMRVNFAGQFGIILTTNLLTMYKRKITTLLLSLFILYSVTGCSNDDDDFTDVDGQSPTIALTTEHIRSEAGREFLITGKVEDKDGIRSIRLVSSALELDKTIDLLTIYEELKYSYDLSYKFKTAKTFTGDNITITVTVTDVGGRSTESSLLLTMDGDFTAPTFKAAPDAEVTVLIKEDTKFNLKFSAEDDKALDYVEVSIPEISYSKKLVADGKSISHNEAITLPSSAATYNLKIVAVDKAGLITTKETLIAVSEMPDFQKMYLVDVSDAALMNSDVFGIPMLIERVKEYTYKARYYSEAAGTEIRFVPQKTDFSPICFGLDPDDDSILTDEPDRSLPLVLPTGKAYYEIEFNTRTSEYSVKTYTPTDKPVAIGTPMYLDGAGSETIPLEIGLVGAGLPNAGNWNTAQPYPLKLDSSNPYLFSAEMTLSAGDEVEFIIQTKHSWGWWPEPFWRWNVNGADPEYNVSNGGENPAKWKISTSGKYMFKFDTHLLRSRFYPIN